MKSMISLPSQYLPEGLSKNVSPLGDWAGPNAAERPPVSEFESPKLNTAGKEQIWEPERVAASWAMARTTNAVDAMSPMTAMSKQITKYNSASEMFLSLMQITKYQNKWFLSISRDEYNGVQSVL